MEGVRGGHVDRVDIRVRRQALVVAVAAGDAEAVGERIERSMAREATATMVPSGIIVIPSANCVAIFPGPTTPQRITGRSSHAEAQQLGSNAGPTTPNFRLGTRLMPQPPAVPSGTLGRR